jgi:hypothetical protein
VTDLFTTQRRFGAAIFEHGCRKGMLPALFNVLVLLTRHFAGIRDVVPLFAAVAYCRLDSMCRSS